MMAAGMLTKIVIFRCFLCKSFNAKGLWVLPGFQINTGKCTTVSGRLSEKKISPDADIENRLIL